MGCMKIYKTVTQYIQHVPKDFLPRIKEIRSLIKKLVPKGIETIKYGMPTIELNGKNFIHFASMKGHLGFYPTPSGIKPFEDELQKKNIDFSKGCIRLPYCAPLPVPLITKIIKSRLKEERVLTK